MFSGLWRQLGVACFSVFFLFVTVFLASPASAASYVKLIPNGGGYDYQLVDSPPADAGNRISINSAGNSAGTGTNSGTAAGIPPGTGGAGITQPPAGAVNPPGRGGSGIKINSGAGSTGSNSVTFKSPYRYTPPAPSPSPGASVPSGQGGTGDPAPDPGSGNGPVPPASGLTASEQTLIDLINRDRAASGLPALQVDVRLVQLARMKSRDMIDNNYFDHISPTYGTLTHMLTGAGVSFKTAGENIAGNQTVEGAHRRLMNSSGHRANILGASYTHAGVGVVAGGPYGLMITELFIGVF